MSMFSKQDYELVNLGVCIKNQADRLGIEHDGVPLEGVVVRIAEAALRNSITPSHRDASPGTPEGMPSPPQRELTVDFGELAKPSCYCMSSFDGEGDGVCPVHREETVNQGERSEPWRGAPNRYTDAKAEKIRRERAVAAAEREPRIRRS